VPSWFKRGPGILRPAVPHAVFLPPWSAKRRRLSLELDLRLVADRFFSACSRREAYEAM
jgi:hypothetical protein